jgi:hypothetical protein
MRDNVSKNHSEMTPVYIHFDKSEAPPSIFIVHKDQLVRQWMIIKIRYSVCVKHIGGVCNAIEVIL